MPLTTDYQKIDSKMDENIQQQETLVHLGQLALSDVAPADLMSQAAELITKALPADYALVWSFPSDQDNLILMANAGLESRPENKLDPLPASGSLEDFILASESPVIVSDLRADTRFRPASLVVEQGAVCGVGLRIGMLVNPYGVIEAFSRQVRTFLPADLQFLQMAAQILAVAIHGKRCEEKVIRENQTIKKELAKAQFVTRSGHFEWDRYDVKKLLIESRERERLRLAQELHDSPIQDLYGLIYQLDDLSDALKDSQSEDVVEECTQTLHRTVNSLRTICRELRPPSLSPFGLEVAIRDHIEKFMDQNPEVVVHLDLMRDQQVLSDSLRLSLFRVYQEAIHNVARHARATEIYIRFRWDEEMILLEIEDNGEGFEVPKNWFDLVRDEHFGILGMAERVENIRGRLEVLSTTANGTLVRAVVPRHPG